MTRLRSVSIIALAAATVSLAACGGEDEPARGADPAAQGAPGSAADALAALGLAEQGRATWGERVQDGDLYTFTNFTLATGEGQLSAETLVIEDPRMSEQGPVFDALRLNSGELTYEDGLAGFAALAVNDAGPGVGQALANLINGEGGFDAIPLDRQTFSSMTLDTLRVRTEAGEDMGPGELVIARMEAGGFDGETLESLSLTDLAYDATAVEGGQIALDIEEIAADGVNLALIQAGAAGEMAANPLVGGASTGMDQYERIAVTGVRVLSGGLRVMMPEFVAAIDERGGGTLVSTAAMPGLTVEANTESPDGPQFAQVLDQLGYESLDFSFASETEYDPGADRVTTTGENYLALDNGFTMRFEQDVSGIEAYTQAVNTWLAENGGADPAASDGLPPEVLEPLMIHSAAFRLEDRSLMDRVLTMMAEQQGTTPAQLRSQAGLFVAMGAAMVGGESVPPQLVNQLSGALTSFVGQGGTLVVAFDPEAPVSAARFAAEGGPDLTGLTVRHEPAE